MIASRGESGREPDLPELLFVERAVVADPVNVEVDRSAALHPRATGFWRNGEFYRVIKIVETRYEAGETFCRTVSDRGCVDLRRFRRIDSRTMRVSVAWEVGAELDAVEIPKLHGSRRSP